MKQPDSLDETDFFIFLIFIDTATSQSI